MRQTVSAVRPPASSARASSIRVSAPTCGMSDRSAILELVARYIRAADDGDHSGYVNCFTEDSSFEVGGIEIQGRPALLEYITSSPIVFSGSASM